MKLECGAMSSRKGSASSDQARRQASEKAGARHDPSLGLNHYLTPSRTHAHSVGPAVRDLRKYSYNCPFVSAVSSTTERVCSTNEAVATKIAAPEDRLLRILQDYQKSQNFLGLRDRTRADYVVRIKKIEVKFGDMPTRALTDRCARGTFLDWRDELALKSPRQADYAWTVLAAVLAWAKDRGKIPLNPCEKGGCVYHGTRVDKIWSIDDEAAFLKSAPAHLHLPLLMALWTGQRQGDLQ
jgi:hypothetical protein